MTNFAATLVFFVLIVVGSPAYGRCDECQISNRWGVPTVLGLVGNRTTRFLVDTGSDECVVDRAVLQALGIEPMGVRTGQLPGGTKRLQYFNFVEIIIPGLESASVRPVGLDLGALQSVGLQPVDGIIGLDIVSHYWMLVADGSISLSKSAPEDFEIVDRVQFARVDDLGFGRAFIPVKMPIDETHSFQIDTGFNHYLMITDLLFAKLKREGQCVSGLTMQSTTLAGKEAGKSYIVSEVHVAGVCVRNVPIVVGKNNAIGTGVLRHLRLSIDFLGRQIAIGKPPAATVDKFAINASGMAVTYDKSEKLRVLSIRPDGSAFDVGIQVDDEVLALDGKNPSDLSLFDVREILAQNGKTISVTFRRGTEDRTVNLPLKLPFEYPPKWADIKANAEDFEQFLKDSEAQPGKKSK